MERMRKRTWRCEEGERGQIRNERSKKLLVPIKCVAAKVFHVFHNHFPRVRFFSSVSDLKLAFMLSHELNRAFEPLASYSYGAMHLSSSFIISALMCARTILAVWWVIALRWVYGFKLYTCVFEHILIEITEIIADECACTVQFMSRHVRILMGTKTKRNMQLTGKTNFVHFS